MCYVREFRASTKDKRDGIKMSRCVMILNLYFCNTKTRKLGNSKKIKPFRFWPKKKHQDQNDTRYLYILILTLDFLQSETLYKIEHIIASYIRVSRVVFLLLDPTARSVPSFFLFLNWDC